MWTTLLSYNYAKGAAIATVLLAIVALVVIPYLVSTVRAERRGS